MRYRTASAGFRWLEVAAQRTLTTEGAAAGVSGTLNDVTDRYESEQMKEQFFALISHELRTLLAAILGYLELLDEEEGQRLSDDGREFIVVMQRNGQRLMRLIGDLLFAAQVESGTLSPDPSHWRAMRTMTSLRSMRTAIGSDKSWTTC